MGNKNGRSMKNEKLQQRLWIANENPESKLDLSECDLEDVPLEAVAICKQHLKEVVILHTNRLISLSSFSHHFKHLTHITVLDLHRNAITDVPVGIHYLTNLKVLNLSQNKVVLLTDEVGQLQNLHALDLSGNRLKELPESLSCLRKLEELDISGNDITHLPVSFCAVLSLQELKLDISKMIYPKSDICILGTDAIMRKLCQDGGIEYVPSHVEKVKEDNPRKITKSQILDSKLTDDILRQEQEEQARDSLLLESAQRHDELKKKNLMDSLKEEQSEEAHLIKLLNNRDAEKKETFEWFEKYNLELENLLARIIERNKELSSRQACIAQLEAERSESSKFVEKMEQHDMLRKEEMMLAMRLELIETAQFQEVIQDQLKSRKSHIQQAAEMEDLELNKLMSYTKMEREAAVSDLLAQEECQKKVFESMMKKRDETYHQLTEDIKSLENELSRLSWIELENRSLAGSERRFHLEEQRAEIANLLQTHLKQRQSREQELMKVLMDMERQKAEEDRNFWLHQMQILLDSKPQELIDQETDLEWCVTEILKQSGGTSYIPHFCRHRITLNTLAIMSDNDLAQLGVRELGIRKAILKNTELYLDLSATGAKNNKEVPPTSSQIREATPTAPPMEAAAHSLLPTEPTVIQTHMTGECVICMEKNADVIFLLCGHVCCCSDCSQPLRSCPLCRADIMQQIILEH